MICKHMASTSSPPPLCMWSLQDTHSILEETKFPTKQLSYEWLRRSGVSRSFKAASWSFRIMLRKCVLVKVDPFSKAINIPDAQHISTFLNNVYSLSIPNTLAAASCALNVVVPSRATKQAPEMCQNRIFTCSRCGSVKDREGWCCEKP